MEVNRKKRAASESLGFLLLVGGILVAVNVLGVLFFGRFDATKNELFSLSKGSKKLASELSDQLQITAYFTEDLPPPFNATERYVRDILDEYVSASKGTIRVEYVNPDTDEERERALEDGISPVSHQVYEQDGISVKEGYRGLVMNYLKNTEKVPVVQDTSGLEYQLTMNIKKLVGERTSIGLLSGHESPTTAKGLSGLSRCLPTYDVKSVSAVSPIDPTLKALLIVEPHQEIPEAELRKIDEFVMKGGSLGVFAGGMKVDLKGEGGTGPQASKVSTGVNQLLSKWGVEIEEGLVADLRCGRVPMRASFGMQMLVPYPLVPIVSFDAKQAEHPVLFRLDASDLPFSAPLKIGAGGSDYRVSALAASSENSWLMTGDTIGLEPRDPREWNQTGKVGPFPLIATVEGTLPSAFSSNQSSTNGEQTEAPALLKSAKPSRVLVVSGAAFLRDEAIPQGGQGECQLTNRMALALNAVDWLAQDSDLIAIRAKSSEDPPIEVPANVKVAEEQAKSAEDQAKQAAGEGDEAGMKSKVQERDEALEKRKAALAGWESKKSAYKWGNILGVPAIFALFGFLRWRSRQRNRKNISL